MFIPPIDIIKYGIGDKLRTAEGRRFLIDSAMTSITDEHRSSNPSQEFLGTQIRLLKAILERCDGTEGFDETSVRNTVSGHQNDGKTVNKGDPQSEEASALLETLVGFIHTFPKGPISDEALHSLAAGTA